MNKKLLTAVSLGLVSAIAIAGTIAYFTIEDKDENIMKNGYIQVEQTEYERIDTNGKLKEFTQYKPLYPAVGNLSKDGDWELEEDLKGEDSLYSNANNVQDKLVFVKNTGKNSIYYRTIIAVEAPKDEKGNTIDKIELNRNEESFKWSSAITTEINGVQYVIYEAIYKDNDGVLERGEVSKPSLLQVFLDKTTKNEEAAAYGDTFEILVKTQAMQAEGTGYNNPEDALNGAFGKIDTTNHPWINGVDLPTVDTADEMQNAVADGKNVIMTSDITGIADETNGYGATFITQKNGGIIDGGNNTLTATDANDTWDSAISTKGGTIKNINVRGAFRGIFLSTPKEDVIIDNVTIDETCYTISADNGGNQNLIVRNSTLNGWTSYAGTVKSATFTNCSFGKGTGAYTYAYFRPYSDTTLTNCDFEAGYEIDARAKITLQNCTIDGVDITSDNIGDLVKNGLDKVTIK